MYLFFNSTVYFALTVITVISKLFFLIVQEHFYDVDSGTGYIACRVKTVQRNTFNRAAKGNTASSDLP